MTTKGSITFTSNRTGPPDLRFLHYNDVYHIEGGTRDPVGGASRFVSLVNHYRSSPEFEGLPELITFFSGDAFNPSLESTVTKGKHMVPILNRIYTNVACVGNHDLDFGVEQFGHLTKSCEFPWLCANVEDPSLGDGVSIAGLQKGLVLTASNGVKIGVVGLVEKEWLDTINGLPEGLVYTEPADMARSVVPKLKEQGAELMVVVSHQREPNDIKLAETLGAGLVDIILGGHDHHYAHQLVNGVHVIRSGCDFKQLSYIEARRRNSDTGGWDFDIVRRDITTEIPEDPETVKLVDTLTVGLKAKLQKPVGFTSVPLDARFTVIRRAESNYANFICDLMRFYYSTDCAIMAGGTMRGDQIYPPGVIKLGDIVNCFPFEDPVIVVRVTGKGILDALENGVSKIPALEGRFPHVSNISFTFDPSAPPGARILECKIAGDEIVPEKKYSCATRCYMAKGRDGFVSLSPDQGAEEVLDEENGVLISVIIRQYFLSLKVLGRWRHGSTFRKLFSGLKHDMKCKGHLQQSEECRKHEELSDDDIDSGSEWEDESLEVEDGKSKDEKVVELLNKIGGKWARLAGVRGGREGEMEVDWTSAVSPKVEGRIREVKRE